MTRMSLIRQLNCLLALLLAGFSWLLMSALRKGSHSLSSISWATYDFALLPLMLGITLGVAIWMNRRWLRWVAAERPFGGSLLLVLLYGYCANFVMDMFLLLQAPQESLRYSLSLFREGNRWEALERLFYTTIGQPIGWMVYLWPITLLVLLLATPVAGTIFRYLYQRRDYLPDEIPKETV